MFLVGIVLKILLASEASALTRPNYVTTTPNYPTTTFYYPTTTFYYPTTTFYYLTTTLPQSLLSTTYFTSLPYYTSVEVITTTTTTPSTSFITLPSTSTTVSSSLKTSSTSTTSKVTSTLTTTASTATVATSASRTTSNVTKTITPTTNIITSARPIRVFKVLIVARNMTFNLTNEEMKKTEVDFIRNEMADLLNVNISSIGNFKITDVGGTRVTIVKRSLTSYPSSESTIFFEITTDIYESSEDVKRKLNQTYLQLKLANNEKDTPDVYVWTDTDNCPSSPCGSGYECTYKPDYNKTQSIYVPSCSLTQSPPAEARTYSNKLLYLLLCLLIIPVAILVSVGVYFYQKKRKERGGHFVNRYSKNILQAPNHSNHLFDSLSSEKSKIMIMGGEGSSIYETNPRFKPLSRGTVTSTHAFDNHIFKSDDHRSDDGFVKEQVLSVPEGENSMTFSYMQMRNSKVNDDTMGLF